MASRPKDPKKAATYDKAVTQKALAAMPKKPPETNWAESFWGSLQLPPQVQAQIDSIFRANGDTTAALTQATTYLRTTDWYKTNFAGIDYGMRAGITRNEAEYRDYVQQVNEAYRAYMGRQVTSAEIAALLQNGRSASWVTNEAQGVSIAKANASQWQALAGAQTPEGPLSQNELVTLGAEQAGNTTALGDQIQARMQAAAKRLAGVFQGQAATGSISLGPQGPFSQTLQGQKAGSDVGA